MAPSERPHAGEALAPSSAANHLHFIELLLSIQAHLLPLLAGMANGTPANQ